MPTTATDRLSGLSTSVAVKPPCVVAATANITLSGTQTINGVAVVAGDRVLVTAQTSSIDNGIWIVSTGAWSRAKDFDGARDVVCGTLVQVYRGAGTFVLYGVSTTGDILPGTTSIAFESIGEDSVALQAALASTASASDNDALVGKLRVAAGAVATTYHAWSESLPYNLKGDFGSPDSASNGSAGLTAALAAIAAKSYISGIITTGDAGTLTLAGDFTMTRETRIDMGVTQVNATPTARLFNVGWNTTGSGNNIGRPQFYGGVINLYGASTTCFAIQNSGSVTMRDVTINLKANGQTGIHLKAGNSPPSPYYGLIDGLGIRGHAVIGGTQTGLLLEGLPELGSLCVNRWHINNITDCAAMDYGIDIRGADGLCLNNINLESLYSTAMRFGSGCRSYTGAVTTAGAGPGSFIDTGLIGSTLDQAATLNVTSGPNSGESCRITSYNTATGEVILPFRLEEQFTVGNTFVLTEAKARNIKATNVTYEGGTPAAAGFYFTAGALNCEVNIAMSSQVGGNIFQRDIEELSNTIASRYDVFVFEGALTSGSGRQWLDVGYTATNQGGFVLPKGAWIDAVFVSESIRTGTATVGEIDIETYVNGTQVAAATMTPRLTQISPNFARRIRKTLTNADFHAPGSNIQVAANKNSMAIATHVRVEVYVAYSN